MLRVKIQKIRSLLWIGNLLTFCGIALLIGRLYVGSRPGSEMFAYIPNKLIEAAVKVDGTIKPPGKNRGLDISRLSNCWQLNVTGELEETGLVPPEVEIKTPPLRPIEEVLRVEMIVAAHNFSRAAIHYLKGGDVAAVLVGRGPVPPQQQRTTPRKAEKLLEVGDQLRSPYDGAPYHARIQDITAAGVKFTWGRGEVVLPISRLRREGIDPRTMPAYGQPSPPASLR